MRLMLRVVLGLTVFVGVTSMAATAHAAPILWTLEGVTYDILMPGGVTGSFVYDADTNVYSDVAITTSPGGISYDTNDVDTSLSNAIDLTLVTNFGAADLTGENKLIMFFSAPLTNAGGIVGVLETQEGVCFSSDCAFSLTGRGSTGRVVGTPVPEPASMLLIGLALAGAGVQRWRHRRE